MTSWADIDEDDRLPLPPPTEIVGKNGVRTVVEYSYNESKQRVKTMTKVRTFAFKKRVYHCAQERRKTWKKFGDCADVPPGPEDNITYVSFDPVVMEDPNAVDDQTAEEKDADIAATIKASFGKGAWRKKREDGDESTKDQEGEEGGTKGYVPPHLRGLSAGVPLPQRESGGSRFGRDDGHTLRVTNIGEDIVEADLQDLFRPFGRVLRVYVAKDRVTMQCRGFAFVTFLRKEDAERAQKKLNGYLYSYLVLSVEWAKPSKRENTGMNSTFRSGYGKALPQGLG